MKMQEDSLKMSRLQRPLLIVAGTRPEIIKLTPVMECLDKLGVEYVFVWSGQHYDYELSEIFFEELHTPKPHINLNVGSGSHAEQTAKIMVALEEQIKKINPSIIVAEGDTNTVVASSLTSIKCQTPFAHVEAGLRSWNITMPEEVNRKVADAIATIHFAPTKLAVINLLFEGISSKNVYLTGNTIVDIVNKFKDLIMEKGDAFLSEYGLNSNDYILVTLHRAENTDSPQRLGNILKALAELSQQYDVIFPIHPRTKNRIVELGLEKYLQKVKVIKPLGYIEFLSLLANCSVVLTDSGGVQEEAFVLRVPTVTLRYNTERPETTIRGLNRLAGADTESIIKLTLHQVNCAKKVKSLGIENLLGDGRAGERIAKTLKELSEKKVALEEPDLRETPMITYALLDNEASANAILEAVIGFDKNGEPCSLSEDYWKLLARIKKNYDTCTSNSK
jgi:UDP-N-acetylglucosamine 2-epimerase (non-hydrolysing)